MINRLGLLFVLIIITILTSIYGIELPSSSPGMAQSLFAKLKPTHIIVSANWSDSSQKIREKELSNLLERVIKYGKDNKELFKGIVAFKAQTLFHTIEKSERAKNIVDTIESSVREWPNVRGTDHGAALEAIISELRGKNINNRSRILIILLTDGINEPQSSNNQAWPAIENLSAKFGELREFKNARIRLYVLGLSDNLYTYKGKKEAVRQLWRNMLEHADYKGIQGNVWEGYELGNSSGKMPDSLENMLRPTLLDHE